MIDSFRMLTRVLLLTVAATLAHAQDTRQLAAELISTKGGYIEKKRQLEDMRLQAYVPILLRAVGKGPQWNPSHAKWQMLEQRITTDWINLNNDHARRLGRDTSYGWFDQVLAGEYAKAFSSEELQALTTFHSSAAGRMLLDMERELLIFHPAQMVSALTRAMGLNEPLSGEARNLFQSPESRARRDFLTLFETETIIREEAIRVGGAYVQASYPAILQSAIAAEAPRIDELRARLTAVHQSSITAFINSGLGRKEREFLSRVTPAALSAPEDPKFAMEQESAFYENLAALSTQWKKLAVD